MSDDRDDEEMIDLLSGDPDLDVRTHRNIDNYPMHALHLSTGPQDIKELVYFKGFY
jgi:hypothetical protein